MDNLQSLKIAKERLLEAEKLIAVAIERGKLTTIDRDLVLEKIRRVYDDIIFEQLHEMPNIQRPKVTVSKEQVEIQPEKAEPVTQQETVKTKVEPIAPKVEVIAPTAKAKVEELEIDANELKFVNKFTKLVKRKYMNQIALPQTIEPSTGSSASQAQGEILADKFKDTRKFRNESITASKKDVASKMQNKPIVDLTKSIGINDKFLYTKELFGGNAELYKNTITALNNFTDINDALIYVQENFHWDENNEAANQLLELVRRKLLAI